MSSFVSTSWILALQEPAANFGPSGLSTSSAKLLAIIPCNFARRSRLDASSWYGAGLPHENTIPFPASFRERVGHVRSFLRDDIPFRSGRSYGHVDKLTWHRLDDEDRRHV